jgi:hypothetical protein
MRKLLRLRVLTAKQALPAGKTTVRFEFAYDGGGFGRGGAGAIFVDGSALLTLLVGGIAAAAAYWLAHLFE